MNNACLPACLPTFSLHAVAQLHPECIQRLPHPGQLCGRGQQARGRGASRHGSTPSSWPRCHRATMAGLRRRSPSQMPVGMPASGPRCPPPSPAPALPSEPTCKVLVNRRQRQRPLLKRQRHQHAQLLVGLAVHHAGPGRGVALARRGALPAIPLLAKHGSRFRRRIAACRRRASSSSGARRLLPGRRRGTCGLLPCRARRRLACLLRPSGQHGRRRLHHGCLPPQALRAVAHMQLLLGLQGPVRREAGRGGRGGGDVGPVLVGGCGGDAVSPRQPQQHVSHVGVMQLQQLLKRGTLPVGPLQRAQQGQRPRIQLQQSREGRGVARARVGCHVLSRCWQAGRATQAGMPRLLFGPQQACSQLAAPPGGAGGTAPASDRPASAPPAAQPCRRAATGVRRATATAAGRRPPRARRGMWPCRLPGRRLTGWQTLAAPPRLAGTGCWVAPRRTAAAGQAAAAALPPAPQTPLLPCRRSAAAEIKRLL